MSETSGSKGSKNKIFIRIVKTIICLFLWALFLAALATFFIASWTGRVDIAVLRVTCGSAIGAFIISSVYCYVCKKEDAKSRERHEKNIERIVESNRKVQIKNNTKHKSDIKSKKTEISSLKTEISTLKTETSRLETEISTLKEEKEKLIENNGILEKELINKEQERITQSDSNLEQQNAKDKEIARLKTEKEEAIAKLKTEKEEEIARLKTEKEEEMARLKTEKEEEIARLKTEKEEESRQHEAEIDEFLNRCSECKSDIGRAIYALKIGNINLGDNNPPKTLEDKQVRAAYEILSKCSKQFSI